MLMMMFAKCHNFSFKFVCKCTVFISNNQIFRHNSIEKRHIFSFFRIFHPIDHTKIQNF